ncbi:MAG TPA: glycoside hydrolase family 5 protein [Prolixibacteraceae bacterium]|nr:glycoside hydrolase family 5 protein [Prolixibacteraceae bacterium]
MKYLISTIALILCLLSIQTAQAKKVKNVSPDSFIRVNGPDLLAPDGGKFFIRGTNLGNWLNPEGYMFLFKKTNAPRLIDNAIREMAGPDFANKFWKLFKDNYVTREDINFLHKTGVNTIRLPFHYKLFTDEDYMGLSGSQDGFQRTDSLVSWCKQAGIYIILDMHDGPGGQTGDNIDDSYGYPWLMESPQSQQLFLDIWVKIATRYQNEPAILGYDLLNEPIAPYFGNDMDKLNAALEPLYKKAVTAIRKVDTNHIILLGGAQWNGNFAVFSDWKFDNKIMYTCHRYGGQPTAEAIKGIIEFRNKTNLPMYMGEIGHNKDEWISAFCKTLEENNIGYTFWPYKKMGDPTSFVHVNEPDGWQKIVEFTEKPRGTYKEVREARPDQALTQKTLMDYIENCKFSNCTVNGNYIKAIGLHP